MHWSSICLLILAVNVQEVVGCCPTRFQDIWMYLLTPFITMAIGYGTNMVAVKMLFHPRIPIKLGCFTLHGIFPKRQAVLAEKVGSTVAEKLLTHTDIRSYMLAPEFAAEFTPVVQAIVHTLITKGLSIVSPTFPIMFNSSPTLKKSLQGDFEGKLLQQLPNLIKRVSKKMEESIHIDELVTVKIKTMSLDEMEKMFLSFMKEEFKFIEFLGGFLGFFVGLIQAIIFYIFLSKDT